MGINIHVEDHGSEVIAELKSKIPSALEEIGLAAEGYAKRLAPVDTGRLRNSISHTVEGTEAAVVGTNVEYAPYVELGTSKTGAQPYLRPSIEDHAAEYKALLEAWLKK